MRQNKFKKGDIINNLIILDKDKIITTNNGSKKTYWICKCKLCGSIKSKTTQTIEHCKSCGCKQREKNRKVCKICGRKHKGLGYCNKHYLRFKKYGNPLYLRGKEESLNGSQRKN